MRRTTLRIASLAAGTAILIGGISSQASADKRLVTVTLAGGRIITLTLDGTPGVPIDKSQLPDLGAPVLSISETALPGTETQTQAQPTATTPPAPLQTTPVVPTTGTTPPPSTGTTGPTGTTGTTGTTPATTPGTGTGTGTTPGTGTGTGTTPTTGTGTTEQPDAVGGVVTTGRGGKGRGGKAVPKTDAGSGAAGALTDANRDGTATPNETPDTPVQTEGAQPTPDTPGYTVAPTLDLSPAGVPNFFIEQFRIPPFLLPIYQAAAMQYGVPWQILAAINEIETDYGRNLSVSSAGALGWMQFMPGTWDSYGVDANGDGQKDPYNPVDAIFAAARYLKAAGAETDLYKAIFAYNHADWYVQSVLLRARVIGGMPADLVGSLTGLTQGRFPVAARATYADSIDVRRAGRRVEGSNAAVTVEGDADRRSINIYAARDAPVVAVNDGTIVKLGENDETRPLHRPPGRLRQPLHVQPPRLDRGEGARPEGGRRAGAGRRRGRAGARAGAHRPAAAGRRPETGRQRRQPGHGRRRGRRRQNGENGQKSCRRAGRRRPHDAARRAAGPVAGEGAAVREPSRPDAFAAGGERQLDQMGERLTTFQGYFSGPLEADPADYLLKPLREGSTVIAGTILGRVDRTSDRLAPHVEFTIRPAGRGAPRIDPKPILDGWKLLESTAIYKAGNDSVFGRDGAEPSIGQILLMNKQELIARVLSNPNIEIYAGGREDVRTGQIDRRVLATLEFLSASGLKPTVTSLKGNHGLMTASGNVSEHSTGTAVDIGAINGIVIQPSTQGDGSITDITIRRLLTLQGTMKPHQIISLMSYPGTDNTLSLPDHDDHIHVGFYAVDPATGEAPRIQSLMRPEQWTRLVDQLGTIENPVVPTTVSRYAIEDRDAR